MLTCISVQLVVSFALASCFLFKLEPMTLLSDYYYDYYYLNSSCCYYSSILYL